MYKRWYKFIFVLFVFFCCSLVGFFVSASSDKRYSILDDNLQEFIVSVNGNGVVNMSDTWNLYRALGPSEEKDRVMSFLRDFKSGEILKVGGKEVLFAQKKQGGTKVFYNWWNEFDLLGARDFNGDLVLDLSRAVKPSWVNVNKKILMYNEFYEYGSERVFAFYNEDKDWFVAPAHSVKFRNFYTYKDDEIKVVMKDSNKIDVETTVRFLSSQKDKLPFYMSNLVSKKISTVEIKRIEGVDLLFVDYGDSMEVLFWSKWSIFKDAFRKGLEWSIDEYDEQKIVKAGFVEPVYYPILGYNEVLKDGKLIGYTLKNQYYQWFYAPKKQETVPSEKENQSKQDMHLADNSIVSKTYVSENKTPMIENKEENVNDKDGKKEKLDSKVWTNCSIIGSSFSSELNKAYLWACENGLTAASTIFKANMSKQLTRWELAKMMTLYMTKVLWKQPPLIGAVEYLDVDTDLGDLRDYIQMAYQFQIMGVKKDGTALENFHPYRSVTRAEFATVFSRVLYWDKYNQTGETWASWHLEALRNAGILKDTSSTLKELRGRVMLMLMRSVQKKQ